MKELISAKRQDLVQIFAGDSTLRHFIIDGLKTFPDLHRLAKKFARGKALLQDVVRLYQVVQNLPKLIATFEEYTGENSVLIQDTFTLHLKVFLRLIVETMGELGTA